MTEPRERLDAYLDDQLDAEAAAALEAQLGTDDALRAEVELQREIDASLGRVAAPPDPAAILARARAEAAAPAGEVIRPVWKRVVVYAAAAAILATVGVGIWSQLAPPAQPDEPETAYKTGPPRPLHQHYALRVKDGFQPDWVCKDEAEFVGTFAKRLGQGLALDAPEGTQATGIAYLNALTSQTVVVLLIVEEREVLVFVDRLERDRPQKLPDGSTLHLHRSEIGELVLYELSPFAAPKVLAAFSAR